MFNRQVISTPKASFGSASRRRAAAAVAFLALGGLPAFAIPASAGDILTMAGVRLAPTAVALGVQDIRRTVDLNGDAVLASYVAARTATGATLMRTRNGYWLPWSGRIEDLGDVGATAQGGALEFKILKEEITAANLPITVSVGYRTAAGVKFGEFEIIGR